MWSFPDIFFFFLFSVSATAAWKKKKKIFLAIKYRDTSHSKKRLSRKCSKVDAIITTGEIFLSESFSRDKNVLASKIY